MHPRWRTPHLSTALTGIGVAIAAGLLPISVLSQLVSIGTLLAFVLVSVGVMVLRRTRPELERPFRTPWMPWVPILSIVACVAQMASLPLPTWVRLFTWLALGMAVYFLYGRTRSRAAHGLPAPSEAAEKPMAVR